MAHFISIPACLFDEGLKHSDITVQVILLHFEALQEGLRAFFFFRVPKSLNKVKDKVIPQPFICWGYSLLVDLVGQMICIFMAPFINCISFDITKGQSGPLHWHLEELMSWVQHAYNSEFVLELVGFCSISIKVIYVAIYLSSQITALVISFKIISISIVVIVILRWSIQWSLWWPWQSAWTSSSWGSTSSSSSYMLACFKGSCRGSKIIWGFTPTLFVQVLSLKIADFIRNGCRWSHQVVFLCWASSS